MADTLYLQCYVKYRLPIFTARYRMFRPVQWPFQGQPVKDPWFNKSWVVLIVILMPLRSYWKTYKRFWFFSLPIWAKARPMRQEILKGFNPDLADNSIIRSDKKTVWKITTPKNLCNFYMHQSQTAENSIFVSGKARFSRLAISAVPHPC